MRVFALPELLKSYLRCRNSDPLRNPLDRRDENNTKRAFALLQECFPHADSSDIDGNTLQSFQIFLVQKKGKGGALFSRDYCNTLLKFTKTVFFWATTQTPPIISEARAFSLSKVKALKPSPKVRENKRRKDVPKKYITDLLPHLPLVIADMLRLQYLHGMRPGEVCNIRADEIDFDYENGKCWLYQPEKHKTACSGLQRTFMFGRQSQEILKKYLVLPTQEHLFLNRLKNPFTTAVYDRAIKKIIDRLGMKKFTPYQVRHTTATEIDTAFGLDGARAVLGHANSSMTRRYVHNDEKTIQRVATERDSIFNGESHGK